MRTNINIPKRVTIRYLQFILPILLILFCFLAGAIYYFDSANQIKMNQDFSRKVLGQANKTLKTWIDDQLVVLSMIVNDSRVIDACADPTDMDAVRRANEFLGSFHQRNPFYENIALSANVGPHVSFELTAVDGKRHTIGRGVFFADSSHGASIGKSSVEHPMAASLYIEGKPNVVTHVYRSLIYGNPAFILSLPVYKNENFVGAVHMAMPMNYFTDKFVNDVKMGQTGYMFMVDDNGLCISHPDKSFILNEKASERYSSVIARILNGENYFKQRVDNENKIYSTVKFDFDDLNHIDDWYLVFVQNDQEILSSSVRFIWLISAFLIIGFFLVIGVVYLSTVRLLHIGFHDSLTGLYNRNYFEQEVNHISIGRCDPVGFIAIDVDGLKVVNDTLGHGEGDALLVTVGKLIKRCLPQDGIALRLGGDEFAVLLLKTDALAVEKACHCLCEFVAEHNRTNATVPVSVSIGWAIGNLGDGKEMHQIMAEADELMYAQKEVNHAKYDVRFKAWLAQYEKRIPSAE